VLRVAVPVRGPQWAHDPRGHTRVPARPNALPYLWLSKFCLNRPRRVGNTSGNIVSISPYS
jgi:hypothetical protein